MILNFVLCPSFHGATLLALLLNNHTKLSSLGDAIPRRTYDQKCACGRLVSRCEFWQQIEQELDTTRFADLDYLLPMYPRICSHQGLNKILNKGIGFLSLSTGINIWKLFGPIGHEYVQTYLTFYTTICAIQGTDMFVQGSKSLIEFLVLKGFVDHQHTMKIIHLTRDPRGYFNSFKKYYPQTPLKKAAIRWKRYHGVVEKLRRSLAGSNYFLLRYEDLCESPNEQMIRVFRFLNVEPQQVCRAPVNPSKHHLMGNKMIFQFNGTISADHAWKNRLMAAEQKRVLELTQPLSSRFGYS